MARLIIPCEVAAKSIIPAIKALMARELLIKYGMNQNQVAEILGVSQSAVSKYSGKIRGHAVKIEDLKEIQNSVNAMITLLIKGEDNRKEILKFFCHVCIIIREKGLMCQLCHKTDPSIGAEKCNFCLSTA
ncbi:MAG: transcriptional regulator [Candidatus Bathycorpusculaceae bacterium]